MFPRVCGGIGEHETVRERKRTTHAELAHRTEEFLCSSHFAHTAAFFATRPSRL